MPAVFETSLREVARERSGYSIVQAQSHDGAVKMFGKDHPHLKMMPGAWVEIVEIMTMADM